MEILINSTHNDAIIRILTLQGIDHTKRLCKALKDKRVKPKSDTILTVVKTLHENDQLELQYKKYELLVLAANRHVRVFDYLYKILTKNELPTVARILAKKCISLDIIHRVFSDINVTEDLINILTNKSPEHFNYALDNYSVDFSKASYINILNAFERPIVYEYIIEKGFASCLLTIDIGKCHFERALKKLLCDDRWLGLTEQELLSIPGSCYSRTLIELITHNKAPSPSRELHYRYRHQFENNNVLECFFFNITLAEDIGRLVHMLQNIKIPTTILGQKFVELCFNANLVKSPVTLSWCCSCRLSLLTDELPKDILFEICQRMY